MFKYLCFIILGILIYILLNSKDSFNVGIPGINEVCDDESLCDDPFACIEWNTSKMCHKREFWIRKMPFFNAGNKIMLRTIDLPIVFNRDAEMDPNTESMIKNFIKSVLKYYYDKKLRHPPIYIGRFDRYMGMVSMNVHVYLFIINGSIYSFKMSPPQNRWLESINHGQENTEPIKILDGTPIVDIKTPLMMASYLEITGTDGNIIQLYRRPDYRTENSFHITKYMIFAYIEFVRHFTSITSCAISTHATFYNMSEFMTSTTEAAFTNVAKLLPNNSITIDVSDTKICETVNNVHMVNLNQISVGDYDRSELYFEQVIRDQQLKIPTLQYNGSGEPTKLNNVKYIAGGSYGSVYVASNISSDEFTSTTGRAGIAIAFKIYNSVPGAESISGRNDPEIHMIRNINTIENSLDNCYSLGELVNAVILVTNIGDPIAIMQYMDNSLYNLVNNRIFNYNNAINLSNLPFKIAKRLQQLLLCVHGAGFEYTDFKLANLLYRCYSPREREFKLLISFGDLGSLVPIQVDGEYIGHVDAGWEYGITTSYTIPIEKIFKEIPDPPPLPCSNYNNQRDNCIWNKCYYNDQEMCEDTWEQTRYISKNGHTDIFNISKMVVYTYGVVILELYGTKLQDIIDVDPEMSQDNQENMFRLAPRLMQANINRRIFVTPMTDESINRILTEYLNDNTIFYGKLSDYIERFYSRITLLKNHDTDNNKQIDLIVELLRRIFVPPETRITLEEIEVLFTQFDTLELEPESCSQYNDNETQCDRQINCQYNSDSRLCIDI